MGEERLQVQVLGGLEAAAEPGTGWLRGGCRSRYWVGDRRLQVLGGLKAAAGPGAGWVRSGCRSRCGVG